MLMKACRCVLCHAVPRRAVLCCAMLCYAVLCCAVGDKSEHPACSGGMLMKACRCVLWRAVLLCCAAFGLW